MPMAAPVFVFRSNLGKLLLDISRRILWPRLNRLLVADRSIVNSYTCPGWMRLAG